MVLGYIVEKVTGMNLHDYIQMNILDKVQMKESGFITHEHPIPYSSIGYIEKDDKKESTKYLSVYPLFGCGDIYTTASDLSQFDQALMDGKLVSDSSLQQILTPSGLSTYGLGLYKNKEGMAYSVGVLGGWYSIHAYYPDKTSIVILLNVRNKTNIELVLSGIRQIVQANDQEQNQKI
jgi:CubicO group peptidase (beta-lactamase class C family)